MMNLNANIKNSVVMGLMAMMCITVTARPHCHYHHRPVVKTTTVTVVDSKPAVKVTKKVIKKKGKVKKVVITKVIVK